MNIINIICAADENYIQHCAIMLKSVFFNNQDHCICVYIFTEGLSNKNVSVLNNISNLANHKIEFVNINSELLHKCPIRINDHITIASYYRLLAPVLLPNVTKALYLDCDIIVNGDISDLYCINIDKYAIGAVIDQDITDISSNFNRLEFNRKFGYFNAGVVLLNLQYWRNHKITEKCFDFIDEHTEKCLFHDQDAMNKILFNCKKDIDIKYNFQTGFLLKLNLENLKHSLIYDKIHKVTEENSYIIIHFTGTNKPWKASNHPYRSFYNFYKEMTVYRDVPSPKIKLTTKQKIYNLLVRLRIKKKYNIYIVDDYDKYL